MPDWIFAFILYVGNSFSLFPIIAINEFLQAWSNVLIQDFTEFSDIDWSQTVTDIDRQLYAKYGLNEDEISFIESMIKPM